MNPNHYLAVAIDHYTHRADWPDSVAVGKTAVSLPSIIDWLYGRPAGNSWRSPSGSSGSSTDWVSGTPDLGARSRPVRRSCAATGRGGDHR